MHQNWAQTIQFSPVMRRGGQNSCKAAESATIQSEAAAKFAQNMNRVTNLNKVNIDLDITCSCRKICTKNCTKYRYDKHIKNEFEDKGFCYKMQLQQNLHKELRKMRRPSFLHHQSGLQMFPLKTSFKMFSKVSDEKVHR